MIAMATAVAAAIIFVFPAETWWMPKCAFYHFTGYKCPGCGTLRMVHKLIHGHVAEALSYNPMLPALLLLGIAAVAWPRLRPGREAERLWLVAAFILAYLAWGVVRNLCGW